MFFKLSTLAVLLPFVHALTINTPTNLTSAGTATISWTTGPNDPSTWSLELSNPNNFHNTFAIANNVDPAAGSINIPLPPVPSGDGYIIEAVNITNINDVFAMSGDFSIAPAVSSTSSSASSTTSGLSSTSGSSAASVTSGSSGASASTSSFGTTVSGSSTPASSGTGTSSTTGSSPSPSSFNGNGAASMGVGSWFAMAAAAIAGGLVAV
ncbi:uncharacterized protein PHACADRAFT_248020 [Phanerochaete carnosa HHB-10118-sp]|uniref:Yeast cell wall synthesis Kre9/Knh1-like N-terminal domain-containing protein n=1 Tax=Phanerochaete carnosa (strain HHB-10118-sp) TaxID=650164 RepID=K5WPN9_PHACS|nr:uncharacterized protein PHACADRAFT_248020 [Phanerochaete carnosa HHB-10118-sp]EKM61425.1 hypothetical protein PHACADRAFT_248020 [Phanerochaete carnosa HHB-10118-sp]